MTFLEITNLINEQYLLFFSELLEKFKYHDELIGPLQSDIKAFNDKLPLDNNFIVETLTDNFLFCLEQISDHNTDYFIYQKEKIPKKNGKVYKNKLPKIGNRTLLKRVLKESNNNYSITIFKNIINYFTLLTIKDENNVLTFDKDYISYVKENFTENKNFSKMIMVIDNIDNILNAQLKDEEVISEALVEAFDENQLNSTNSSKHKNKKNKGKKNGGGIGPDFMKGLENTKIAQLAKNISEKINIEDFPDLGDPAKLLSSLGNPSENNGLQNLLKFVVGEVEGAFKNNNLNEKDLVNEAQDIMGKFQNASGFDPMSLLNNNNFDPSKFADIFANMKK